MLGVCIAVPDTPRWAATRSGDFINVLYEPMGEDDGIMTFRVNRNDESYELHGGSFASTRR